MADPDIRLCTNDALGGKLIESYEGDYGNYSHFPPISTRMQYMF
jgi:hypothetical protein